MPSTTKNTADSSKWQDLAAPKLIDDDRLENIKSHLDLAILALEAIANVSSEAILQAAKDLNLESIVGDRLTLWQLRASNPLGKSTGGKKPDVEEVRSLVLITCYLANQHQELLRRAVSLLEQTTEQNKTPHQTALLGNYLDKFINYYYERINNSASFSIEALSELAWKLLISLLFYSSNNGHCLLWIAIFDATLVPDTNK